MRTFAQISSFPIPDTDFILNCTAPASGEIQEKAWQLDIARADLELHVQPKSFRVNLDSASDIFLLSHRDLTFKPGGIDQANQVFYRRLQAEMRGRG